MSYKLSKRSLSRLRGVEPLLIAIFVDGIENSPYDFGIAINGGYRSAELQNSLYQQGRTTPGNIITNADGYNKKSYHQTGLAIDIYGYFNGQATWDPNILKSIADHLKSVALKKYNTRLEWGGDWTSIKDYPHFQISKGQV